MTQTHAPSNTANVSKQTHPTALTNLNTAASNFMARKA